MRTTPSTPNPTLTLTLTLTLIPLTLALNLTLTLTQGAYDAVEASHFAHGGAGAAALGRAVMAACADPTANSTGSPEPPNPHPQP